MSKTTLEQTGLLPAQAQAINGRVVTGLTAGAAGIGNAAICPSDINIFSTVGAGQTCVLGWATVNGGIDILAVGDFVGICNRGLNALTVYAPTGATINGAASVSLATNACAKFVKLSSTDYGQF